MPQVSENSIKTRKTAKLLGFSSQSLLIFIGFGIVLVTAVSIAVYFYLQYRKTQSELNKSTQSNVQAALIEEVGKLIVLPTGEQPQVATVSDIMRLKGQSFFVHARNGDKVLIYSKAQEAILYDPIVNKIVEVGPISLTQVTPTPTGPTPTPVPVRVAIYNGTSTAGLATKVAAEVEQKMSQATVVAKSDAQQTYTATVVVDLAGEFASQGSTLAKLLNAKVEAMP